MVEMLMQIALRRHAHNRFHSHVALLTIHADSKQAQAPATTLAHQPHSTQSVDTVERSIAVKAVDERVGYLTRKRSTVTVSKTKGRCTLTATCSPLCNLPRYTCKYNFLTTLPFQR